MLTFGSLFAGIGGLDLGLERAGMVCKWQVEIDPYCRQVLAKHWSGVRRYEDVREVGKHNLESVDLIAGGFPCTPHSVAGKRKGAEDDRNLWPEYHRIVAELRPRWVVGENVPGIVTTYLDTVLSDLESEGYTCTTLNLPACAFDAPHRRERIFVVAYAGNPRSPCPGGNAQQQIPQQFPGNRGAKAARIVAHAPQLPGDGKRHDGAGGQDDGDHRLHPQAGGSGADVAHAQKLPGWPRLCQDEPTQERGRRSGDGSSPARQWPTEPGVGRVAYGVPHRVDRLRALGNAVVPQVAEWIGRRIIEAAGQSAGPGAHPAHTRKSPTRRDRKPDTL